MRATHQIIDIYYSDAYYEDLKALKGKRGFFEKIRSHQKGYYAGNFIFARHWEGTKEIGFYAVKIKKL